MKHIIIAVLIAMLLIPGIVSAQEIPPPQPSWQVKPERSIIFIGEDLIVMVNGTGNTSYTLEMRRLDANGTILNATFTYRGLTDANGTQWAVVPDGYNEEPGSYRVQVLLNQIVVTYADVRLDYSFERWMEIQLNNLKDDVVFLNQTDQQGLERDTRIVNLIGELQTEIKILWFVIILYTIATIPLWLAAYKSHCQTKRKRSRLIEILEGVEEDRTMYYGGVETGKDPPRMYGGENSCKNKNRPEHNNSCPHCELDLYANKMGLSNMTHAQIVKLIGGGKKPSKPKAERPDYFERLSLRREYKKRKNVKKEKSDEKKVKP